MWEEAKAFPFGRLSIRNMCMFAAAMFVATFMYILFSSPTVHAADAEWNGDTIVYLDHPYDKIAEPAKAGDSHNLPAGSLIYRYIEPSTSSPSSPTTKADLIYFAPSTDPTKATSGTYVTYDYTPPDVYKNPTGQTTIKLTPQSTVSEGTTSCAVEGIGWIVCPVTNFLASAMDHLFNILASFLTVRPVQSNQENALYRTWSYMRNFANIAFVIAFLIIIYSQITTIGLSNYDIKKMLPRLIIAAVLVNVSYWICAIAIDASNVMGWSIQEIFISMRNNLVGTEGNGWTNTFDFKSVAGVVLSGSTAGAAALFAGYGLVLSAGTITAALYMLLPILVGVLVAVLVALIVMAARQAIITILVIVSPLAFVAYLLPNTEKYFEKWHQLGMTMLLLFPIFSFIFGGSQLAGMAIIQNADSINLILLGMAVQIAPIVITPLLVRFSGTLLARIGGMVNNPGKGLVDRTRKFAEERRDQAKARAFASPLNRKRDAVARLGRSLDTKRRTREGWQKANEATADANWTNSKAYSDIQQKALSAGLIKDQGETNAQTRFETSKRTSAAMQNLDLDARASKLRLDLSKAKVEADWEEIKAGRADRIITPLGLASSALHRYREESDAFAQNIQHDTVDSEVTKSRTHFGQHEQQQHYTAAIQTNATLQAEAGGIAGQHGADSALAAAIANKRKAYGQAVAEAHEIIKHLNLSSDQRQELARGNTISVPDPSTGTIKTFNEDSVYAREAAIEAQLSGEGKFQYIQEIIMNSGSDKLKYFKTTIGDGVAKNKLTEKAAYLGGNTINEIKQGTIKGEPEFRTAVSRTISNGKIQPAHLATMDVEAVRLVLDVASKRHTAGLTPAEITAFDKQVAHLGISAQEALTNTSLRGRVAQNVEPLLQQFVTKWPPTP